MGFFTRAASAFKNENLFAAGDLLHNSFGRGMRGVVRSAAMSAGQSAVIGGVVGGATNRDNNHAGGALSGALKMAAFGAVTGGIGAVGFRLFARRSPAFAGPLRDSINAARGVHRM